MQQYWEVKSKANKTGELLIYGDIVSSDMWGDGVTPAQIDAALKELGDIDTLNVYLNSAGGSVFAGMAIYNIIKRFKAKTKNAYVDGLAASIASVIVMACDKVIMPSNAVMVIHNPEGGVIGDAADMRKMAEALDKVRETILGVYREKTGKTDEELIPMLDAETWMTAEEAVKLGFADEVQGEVKIAASLNDKVLTFGDVKIDTSAFKNFQPERIEAYEPPAMKDDSELKEQQAKFESLKAKLGLEGCCGGGK